MAHKRKKEVVEEEYEFVPPEFDEKKFLENDIRGTKILLLTAAFAIVFGIIAYILGGFNIYLGLIVMVVGMVALRYLYPLAKIPWSTVEKKTFFGNVGLFFFIFLAVWIILLNVPFSDQANPEIRDSFDLDPRRWRQYDGDTSKGIYLLHYTAGSDRNRQYHRKSVGQ